MTDDTDRLADIDEAVARANAEAREWKEAFLRVIGKTDSWAVTTFKLADKDRYFERHQPIEPSEGEG